MIIASLHKFWKLLEYETTITSLSFSMRVYISARTNFFRIKIYKVFIYLFNDNKIILDFKTFKRFRGFFSGKYKVFDIIN